MYQLIRITAAAQSVTMGYLIFAGSLIVLMGMTRYLTRSIKG